MQLILNRVIKWLDEIKETERVRMPMRVLSRIWHEVPTYIL